MKGGENMENIPKFMTIRETARTGILSEYHLRLLEKQGRLPGVRSGNRFKVNIGLLVEQLNRESAVEVQRYTDARSGATV